MFQLRRKLILGAACTVTIIIIAVAVYLITTKSTNENKIPQNPLIVQVEQGQLRGEWVNASDGSILYAAFRGIPYAQPPLKELRFKAPRPPLKWDGIREATTEGSICFQDGYDHIHPGKSQAIGSNDCLYLNVYTPNLQNSSSLIPVYFFIHGGSFISGSGSAAVYGPDFFMLKKIVVVTINYRLNVFGFLNLDNEDVPGNAGVKDQVAALKWVHRNIAQFGGDPQEITVGGQSAGAACAHWMTLLPETKGIPKRVIIESGSAIGSWAYNENNFDIAKDLAQRLTNGPVQIADISDILRNSTSDEIMAASMPLVIEKMATTATELPYAVTPERRSLKDGGETKLITHDPEKNVIDRLVDAVPMFVGMTNREWLQGFYTYGYAANPALIDQRINNLITLIPKDIIPYEDTISFLNITDDAKQFNMTDVINTVGQYYFNVSRPDCNKTCMFKQYLDDIVIGIGIARLIEIRVQQKKWTTYAYRFGVRDAYSISPDLHDPDQANSAVHSDEIGYLWKIDVLNQKFDGEGLASKTLRRMVSMWTTFMKTGVPAPEENFDGTWETAERRRVGAIFMDIRKNLTVRDENIAGDNTPFWFKLYGTYRDGLSP